MLVYVGLAFGILSAVVGHECQKSRETMPGNPIVLQTVSGAAAICVFLLFFFGGAQGFFVPVVGVVLGLALCTLWWIILNRVADPALVSILSGLVSVGAAVSYFL